MRYLLLGMLWAAWCGLHSLLAADTTRAVILRRFTLGSRRYRLLYNGVAVLTLVPLYFYARTLQSPLVFAWQGRWRLVQAILLAASLGLFVAAARVYDLREFLGLRETGTGASGSRKLRTTGILAAIRHPWYTGGMLLIWARDLDASSVITNAVLTLYFIIGAELEERRLAREYGAAYLDYQRRVSRFLPCRWLKSKMR